MIIPHKINKQKNEPYLNFFKQLRSFTITCNMNMTDHKNCWRDQCNVKVELSKGTMSYDAISI